MTKLSIVIPVYYNELNIPITYGKLDEISKKIDVEAEFVFVDDGSGDRSYDVLVEHQKKDPRIKVVKLSRNFGSHVAILAGLSHAEGDCVTIISADLQDPPELIMEMLEDWKKGNEVILAVRKDREEPLLQVAFSNLYYRLMKKYALHNMPEGGFDFVLLDRKVVDVLTAIKEKNTSIMGQILWVGFKHSIHYYTRKQRDVGKSRWTLSKKVKLFIDSFLAFSYVPVRFMSFMGIMLFFLSMVYAGFLIFQKVIFGQPIEGWTSLMVVLLFLSGVQLLSLGVIGEYLWRAFDETRKRPIFIIDKLVKSEDD